MDSGAVFRMDMGFFLYGYVFCFGGPFCGCPSFAAYCFGVYLEIPTSAAVNLMESMAAFRMDM